MLGADHEKTAEVIREFQFCLARRGGAVAGAGRVEACDSDGSEQREGEESDDGVEDMPPGVCV